MEFIKKKVRIKDHVLFDDQSYAGMTGTTDYKADNGKSYWFPVKGFIRKPVDAKKIIPEIEKFIK